MKHKSLQAHIKMTFSSQFYSCQTSFCRLRLLHKCHVWKELKAALMKPLYPFVFCCPRLERGGALARSRSDFLFDFWKNPFSYAAQTSQLDGGGVLKKSPVITCGGLLLEHRESSASLSCPGKKAIRHDRTDSLWCL